MTPYEQSTDELRQVKTFHPLRSHVWGPNGWIQNAVPSYRVQRKWLVEDREGPQSSGLLGYEISVNLPERRNGWTHIHMVPVWRDLPIVSAEEVT